MEIICEIMQWCEGRGFKFHNCDINDDRIPCSLDKKYIPRNNTIFIKGFSEESKSINIAYGGLKKNLRLKVKLKDFPIDEAMKHLMPTKWQCDSCKEPNFDLRTDDGHKTYSCKTCRLIRKKMKENVKGKGNKR